MVLNDMHPHAAACRSLQGRACIIRAPLPAERSVPPCRALTSCQRHIAFEALEGSLRWPEQCREGTSQMMSAGAGVAEGVPGALQSWDVVEETWLFDSIEQPVPARATAQESIPDEALLTAEDLHISWRGDSKYLATSSRSAPGACRSCGLHQQTDPCPLAV